MSESGSCDESRREIERAARERPDRLEGRSGLDWLAWAIRGGCVGNLERLIELGVDVNGRVWPDGGVDSDRT